MNKYQDALLSFTLGIAIDSDYEILNELCERATPKKPEMQAMSGFRPYEANVQVCPCCKEMIVNVWNRADYKPNYCHYCGQALDWSVK